MRLVRVVVFYFFVILWFYVITTLCGCVPLRRFGEPRLVHMAHILIFLREQTMWSYGTKLITGLSLRADKYLDLFVAREIYNARFFIINASVLLYISNKCNTF